MARKVGLDCGSGCLGLFRVSRRGPTRNQQKEPTHRKNKGDLNRTRGDQSKRTPKGSKTGRVLGSKARGPKRAKVRGPEQEKGKNTKPSLGNRQRKRQTEPKQATFRGPGSKKTKGTKPNQKPKLLQGVRPIEGRLINADQGMLLSPGDRVVGVDQDDPGGKLIIVAEVMPPSECWFSINELPMQLGSTIALSAGISDGSTCCFAVSGMKL